MMPEALRLFLERLNRRESDLVIQWLDETNAAVEINAVIVRARKGDMYGAR